MPVQAEIPGTERPKIKEIELAAEAYVSIRDKRMRLTEQEVELKGALIDVVHKHADKITPNGEGERHYRFDDLVVILKPGKDNVKVRSADSELEEDEE